MAEQELLVRIVGDDRSLQQAFSRSSRSAQRFETKTATLGSAVSRGFAAAGISLGLSAGFAAANRMAQAASDLNEEISKSEKVFGSSSQEIQAWAETTANAIGISQSAALSATGTFGNLFGTVGIDRAAAADMSKSLVELAADLASFNNASPDDVLQALRSGLIGEAEPLRRYGVLLSETRVQQVAMADSGKTNVRALTNQEKALARYKIILQDTIPAQGDFADTADGAANAQRRAAAEAADLSANVGGLLLPALQGGALAFAALAGAANDAIGAVKDWRQQLHDTKAFDGWNKAIEDANTDAVGFFKTIRDGIPFMERFLALRDSARHGFGGEGTPPALPAGTDPTVRTPRPAPAEQAAAAKAAAVAAADAIDAATRRANRSLDQQISDVGKRIAHLKQLIREDPANVKLQQRLTAEIVKQNGLIDQQRTLNESNSRAAAAAAKSAHDAAVRAAEDRRQAARDAEREAADRRRTRTQAAQFQAIGLTATGEQRAPGIGALRRRGRSLLNQIAGTELGTPQNRNRIGAVLSKQFKDAGREVRDAILAMFNEISAALEQGQKSTQQKQQTKFRVVNTSNILSGLGLSEEEQQQLRRRLSRLGPGGTSPRPGGAGGAFGFDVSGGGGNTIVNGPVTVVSNDPDDFGRKLERKTRRTALTRTGDQAGRRK